MCVCRSKDRLGLPGVELIIHSCVGNSTPNRKFASDSRVLSAAYEQARSPSKGRAVAYQVRRSAGPELPPLITFVLPALG